MMWASYINEAIIEEVDYLEPYEEPKIFDKYEKIINSNLSILKIWISIHPAYVGSDIIRLRATNSRPY